MNHLLVADRHHAEGDVFRAHVVRALDFVDLVSLGHDDVVVLQDDGIGVDAGHSLSVAVLPTHREIQAERVGVNNIDVACLRAAQRVNSSVEWLVGSDLNSDSRVFAVHRHVVAGAGLITVDIGAREVVDERILGGVEHDRQSVLGGSG